jgi:hypothetical protein
MSLNLAYSIMKVFDVDFVFLNIPVSFEYEFKIGKKRHGNRPQQPFPPYPAYGNRDV